MDTPARTALKTQSRWTSATLTRAAVHLAGLFPLAELAYHAAAQQLTVNPIQFIEQFFGLAALNLLALSLAVTPLITLTGYKTLGRHSRALGCRKRSAAPHLARARQESSGAGVSSQSGPLIARPPPSLPAVP